MGMPWVTGDNVQVRGLCRSQQDARKQDAHLVPLVDALEPLQTKSKTISLMILFDVCVCIVCVCEWVWGCACVCVRLAVLRLAVLCTAHALEHCRL